MSRLILLVTVATIAFIVGVAANWGVNTFGGLAVDHIYHDPAVDVHTSSILPVAAREALLESGCLLLVVTINDNGSLEFNHMPTGTLNDSSALMAKLKTVFDERDESRVYTPESDLFSRVPEYRRIERRVYINAPRSVSYGEVADLMARIKMAGGDPMGLISELPQP